MSLADGTETVLASDETADVADLIIHPVSREVQAVSFSRERIHWRTLEPSIKASLDAIPRIRRGDFGLINRDLADKTWLIYFTTDEGPVYYYRFDRTTQKAKLLFANRSALEDQRLAKMEPITLESRDGLTLHGYLTIPPGTTGKQLPTVLLVHGGPWSRDHWGYNGEVQWLANRGYAVLQVNFRGSRGYGKAFLNAGNREWGGKMQDDLVDAVNWAIERGVTDPDRIAIYGGAYGGYATLVALTDTPDLFRCGVDVVGPSNLITFMENLPPYWKPIAPILWDRVGHPDKDAEFLRSRSPLFKIERITKPLLIAQGANDPRVKRSESRQIVEILQKAGKEVEYVEYPDEGHGFVRPKNRLDFYARAEEFLAKHLGGRFEPPTKERNTAGKGTSE